MDQFKSDFQHMLEDLQKQVRIVPDFPTKGVMFKDLMPIYADRVQFDVLVNLLCDQIRDYEETYGLHFTKIVGLESRGFITASAVAFNLDRGFVAIRKAGKLPGEVYKVTYGTEYSKDSFEMQKGLFTQDDVVLVHDDVLATGGSAAAARDLISKEVYASNIRYQFISQVKELEKLAQKNLGRHFMTLFS